MSPAKGSPLASCDDPFSQNPTDASISQLPVLALQTIAVAPDRWLLFSVALTNGKKKRKKEGLVPEIWKQQLIRVEIRSRCHAERTDRVRDM